MSLRSKQSLRPIHFLPAVIDCGLLVISLLLAVSLRLGLDAPIWISPYFFLIVAATVFLKIVIFHQFGFYRQLWEYASLREALRLFGGVSSSSLILIVVYALTWPATTPQAAAAVGIIDWMLTLTLIGGSRFIARTSRERILPAISISRSVAQRRLVNKHIVKGAKGTQNNHAQTPYGASRHSKRVILIGAGEAGSMLVKKMWRNPDKGYVPIAFLDDDDRKIGMMIQGIRVVASTRSITSVIASYPADEVIMVMPSAGRRVKRRIALECKELGISCKTVPDLVDLVDGEINISQLRDVDPRELLGRKEANIWLHDTFDCYEGMTILITGAAGSIGSELCRQALSLKPVRLIATDISENGLYHLEEEMNPRLLLSENGNGNGNGSSEDKNGGNSNGNIKVNSNGNNHIEFEAKIMDVRDAAAVDRVFSKYEPDIVFHAAAYKHVPMMERHPVEAMHNNVLGTRTLIEASKAHGVKRFTLISTDKAVNPTSMMGLSKRFAEYLIKLASRNNTSHSNMEKPGRWADSKLKPAPATTKFMAVRFGNVLGSNGSVIPKFKRQISDEDAVTVTHPDITRYFMTIHEAVYLVIQATAMGNGGEIFVLDMGEPVKIVDLARSIITLSGYIPDRDIPIKFTGLRPGEKLYEELFSEDENVDKTRHPQIFEVNGDGDRNYEAFNSMLGNIETLAVSSESEDSLLHFLNRYYPIRPKKAA